MLLSKEAFNKKYPKGETIGQGTFGSVYEVKNKSVVVKVGTFISLATDIVILGQINHPNIIKILDVSISKNETMIAFPKGRNILDELDYKDPRLPRIFCELICAVQFLHDQGI